MGFFGRLLSVAALVSMILFAGSGPALAADGSIQVTVLEVIGGEGDQPLVGATVMLSHDAQLAQAIAQTTNVNGQVVFPAVPAGSGYVVTASMPGYGKLVRDQVAVIAGQTSKIEIGLNEELTEQVEVKGTRDVVELETGAQTSTVIDDDFFADLPVLGREYQNVLSLAPGVNDSDGDGNPNVHGSRDRDFQMTVDGVSNVDPLTGKFMSFIAPDAIQEIEIIDSGADASFGGAVGGFGRVEFKEGGNEFEGTVNLFFRDSTFDNDLEGGRDPLDYGLFRPSMFLSGPIVKDSVWFVVSHEYFDLEFPIDLLSGPDFTTKQTQFRSFDRVTWLVDSRSNKLQLQYRADPLKVEPASVSNLIPPDSGSIYELGGPTIQMKWISPFSPTLFWEATTAFSENEEKFSPFNRNAVNECVRARFAEEQYLEGLQCTNIPAGGRRSGAYFSDSVNTRQRWTYDIQGEKFVNEWAGGSHNLKFGFKLENINYERDAIFRDPLSVSTAANSFGAQFSGLGSVSRLSRFVFAPKIIANDLSTPTLINDTARGNYYAFYLSDTYQPLDNLAITVGLRLSREEIQGTGYQPFDPLQERADFRAFMDECMGVQNNTFTFCMNNLGGVGLFTTHQLDTPGFDDLGRPFGCNGANVVNELQCGWVREEIATAQREGRDPNVQFREGSNFDMDNNNLSPRISVSWDPGNDGKTKLVGSWGRFFGQTILLPFLLENGPDFSQKVVDRDEQGRITSATNGIASAFTIDMVDRNLNSQYKDEFALLFEREIAPETSLTVRYLYNKTFDQLQDVDINHSGVLWDDVKDLGILPDGRRILDSRRGCQQIDIGGVLFADCYGNLQTAGAPDRPGLPPRGPTALVGAPDGRPDLQSVSPMFNNVYVIGNQNRTEYEAYIIELERRFYQNWQFTGSYTWSEAVGDAEDFIDLLGDDVTNVQDEKGLLGYDKTHVVKLSGRVLVPRWGGIRLGGFFTYESGEPYSIIEQRDVLDFPTLLNQGTGGQAYGPPAFFQLTTLRSFFPTGQRNDQRNKAFWTFDANVQKEFSIRDVRATFQFDIFNLLGDDTLDILFVRRTRAFDPLTGRQLTFDRPFARRRPGRQFQVGFTVNF